MKKRTLRKRLVATGLAVLLAGSLLAGCGSSPDATGDSSGAGNEGSKAQDESTQGSNAQQGETSQAEESLSDQTEPGGGDGTLRMYVAGFQNLDPQIFTWGCHVDRMGIFEGLVKLNPDFTTRLANAESLVPNEDYTVWTATLRKDLKWSDGTELNANDYYYAFERILVPKYLEGKTRSFTTSAPILNALECQRGECDFDQVGVKLIDDYTIEFTLSVGLPDFDVRLAENWGVPVPRHVIEAYGDNWTTMENIVCNGPYVPVAREEDVHLTLAPNEYYYDEVTLDRVEIYAGEQNQLLAYENGDINVASITVGNLDALSEEEKAQMQLFNTSIVTSIYLLKSSNTVLQDNKALRQAISKAIDRETIATAVMKDTVMPATTLVYPEFAEWSDELDYISYDPEEAARLMEEAGYPNGEGLGKMTVMISGNADASILAVVDMIQRNTGIQCEIVNKEWAAYVADRDAFHDNDGIWGISIEGAGVDLTNVSGAFTNYRYDPRLGNLDAEGLKAFVNANKIAADEEAARATCTDERSNYYAEKWLELQTESDPEALSAGYRELEEIRLDQATTIPLWWNRTVLLVKPSIKGYVGNPFLLNCPPLYFNDITND